MSKEIVTRGNDFIIEQVDRAYGGSRQTVLQVDGATGAITQGPTKFTGKQQATATAHVIADPGTGKAIPVTSSGSVKLVTGAGAETNTLPNPTFIGQVLDIFVDTAGGGTRTITAAAAINQAANTVLPFTESRDYAQLKAISVAGALRWQVVATNGVTPA